MADGQGATYPDDAGSWTPPGAKRCARCGCAPHTDMSKGIDKECPRCGCPPFLQVKKERDEMLAGAHTDGQRPPQGFA